MPSTYSSLLRLLKQATGENSNTWGDLVNSGFLELVEDAIAGTAQIDITAGTGGYSLESNNGTSDESRCAILQFIGSPSVDKTITIPTTSKIYIVWSDLTTAKTLTMSTGAGTSTTLAQNKVDIILVTEDGVKSLLSEQLKSSNNLSDLEDVGEARTNLGLGSVVTLDYSTDGTLADNSDSLIPTQKAVKTYSATAAQGASADSALAMITATKKVLQHDITTSTSATSTSTTIPADNTIPQSTEGAEGMTASFTPTSATSTLRVRYSATVSSSNSSTTGCLALFKDSETSAISAVPGYFTTDASTITGYYEGISGTTSAITFKLRFGQQGAGTCYFNSKSGNSLYGGVAPAYISIEEIDT